MHDLILAAADLQGFLREEGFSFAFIGGIANLVWGKMRFTEDADVTLITNFTDEADIVAKILARYQGRHSDSLRFALQSRVLLLQLTPNITADIGLGGFEYELLAVERAIDKEVFPGLYLRVITAEDLIVMKAFAARPLDWGDIDGIVKRQGGQIDWDYILPQVQALADLKEDPDILSTLQRFKKP